jgi:hypothetical protein
MEVPITALFCLELLELVLVEHLERIVKVILTLPA